MLVKCFLLIVITGAHYAVIRSLMRHKRQNMTEMHSNNNNVSFFYYISVFMQPV